MTPHDTPVLRVAGRPVGGYVTRPELQEPPEVFTAGREGEAAVHGTRADWVALAGGTWTLVFAGATERTRRDPWFVRAGEYRGVGSSPASEERLAVAPGETVVRRIVTVVADGRLPRIGAAALIRKAVSQ
ncbi:DUF6807 family protein [Streptomyces sp. NPDC093568]|uniref:DUF6807 family protein n=1 Tax=Streptomyces sp. NPDC093568 TaxID=3366041 RepID=UPI00381A4EDD